MFYFSAPQYLAGLSGGEVIFKCLLDHGVDTAFGYSGGAVLPLLDAFHESPIKFVMNRHEQCSGHAAEVTQSRDRNSSNILLKTLRCSV